MPEYNTALTSGRANMRVAHFTLGNDNSPDRYVSVARAAEIKNLPADVFFETTNAQRRTDIKNEQMKRSNVLDTVDAEHVEWKSVSKAGMQGLCHVGNAMSRTYYALHCTSTRTAFVDFTESKDYHAATKHGIKEELRQANVKVNIW